jgi:hypothetical protein
MPAGNGLGPRGRGRKNGRGAGYCGGRPLSTSIDRDDARGGWGPGRGGHRHRNGLCAGGLPGWGRGAPRASEEREREVLERQAARLQDELDGIRQRLQRLEPDSAAEGNP